MTDARSIGCLLYTSINLLDSVIIFSGKGGFQLEYYFVTAGAIRDEHGVVHRTYGIALWKEMCIRDRQNTVQEVVP